MDAKVRFIPKTSDLPKITHITVKSWDVNLPILFNTIVQFFQGSTIVFIDGPIGSGKTTMIDYINKFNKERSNGEKPINLPLKLFPEPIDKIKEKTSQLYNGILSIEEVNLAICELCVNQWYPQIPENSDEFNYNYLIEHIPHPFHYWIFLSPFNTDFQLETEKRIAYLKRKGSEYVASLYNQEPLILQTLKIYPKISIFDSVVIVIVQPSVETSYSQIMKRGREEEKNLSFDFIEHLNNKFNRAEWELFKRDKEKVESEIDSLIRKYPLH